MFRKWFRSSYVEFLVLSVFSLTLGIEAHSAKLPKLLLQVEEKYKKSDTLMAAFSQMNESAMLKEKKTSSGVISVKKPGKMRWETQEPDPSIFITDGKTMWFYTPPFEKGESGQLVIRKAQEYQSRLAGALLAGQFSTGKMLKISQKGANFFTLVPTPGSAGDVLEAEIVVNTEKLLIEKVILKHKGGNLTEVSLTKILLGSVIEDELFRFTPPAKTDIVK